MRRRALVLAVLRGLLCVFLASILLSMTAMWLFPTATDRAYADKSYSRLLGTGVWLFSIGLGLAEGYRSWRANRTKEDRMR